MTSDRTEPLGTCDSQVELSMLASGMAKQHESYQDALQELIDNAVSSVVKSESYFDDANESINIVIKLERTDDRVRTTVADNGPGIGTEPLQKEIFKTGNKTESDGILNNVGWGLKASLAWFEETLRTQSLGNAASWFELVTKQIDSPVTTVSGPITGELPVTLGTTENWQEGTEIGNHNLKTANSGTRVHVSCSWARFAEDVWPSASYLNIKAQALREYLGVRYRRVIDAHPENSVHIDYVDNVDDDEGSLEVIPIHPQYKSSEEDPPEEQKRDTFSIELSDDTTFEIEYERGTLDYEAMTTQVAEKDPNLLTSSRRFRTRYRPSQSRQGVDIYANGRVLMTSVFTDLFDLTRNNEYNYFGGTVRIIPKSSDTEVPTDNKKTRIDTNSELWQCLRDKLTEDDYLPSGKRYDRSGPAESESANNKQASADAEADDNRSTKSADSLSPDKMSTQEQNFENMINGDSRHLQSYLKEEMGKDPSGTVDLVVTSPPYFDLKDYGVDTSQQIGQDDSYQEYLEDLRTVLREAYDVVSEDGSLWIVVTNFRTDRQAVDLPGDIIDLCQLLSVRETCPTCSTQSTQVPLVQHGATATYSCVNCEFKADGESAWNLEDIIVWDKHHALPFVHDGQFRNVFEHILCFTKSSETEFQTDAVRVADPNEFQDWWVSYPERYNPRGMIPRNIWEFITPNQGTFGQFDALDHPAPFPPDMVKRIVRLATDEGDTVLDPFAGSGMVPATAEALNRTGIGIEANIEFCEQYPELKSEVDAAVRASNEQSHQQDQDELAEMIMCLRMLKQAKEVLRFYGNSRQGVAADTLEIHSVFQLCQQLEIDAYDRSSRAVSDLLYIVEDGTGQERIRNLEASFNEILSEAPLTQYDIKTSVSVLSNQELNQHIRDTVESSLTELAIYRNGRFYECTDTTSYTSWSNRALRGNEWQRNYSTDEFPPILSNIDLSVQNPRYMSEAFSIDDHATVRPHPLNNTRHSAD